MKKLLLLIMLIVGLPLLVNAQKIEKDYYDQFTGKRIMYTKLEKLNWGYKGKQIGGKMYMRFTLSDDFEYLILHWNCNRNLVVPADAKVQFKLDNGKTINLENELQTQAIRGGAGINKSDLGLKLNCIGDVEKFSTALIFTVRIYTNAGYFDFEIPEKEAIKIHKQYMLFSRTVNTPPLKIITSK